MRIALAVVAAAVATSVPGTQPDALSQLRTALGGEARLSQVSSLRVTAKLKRPAMPDHAGSIEVNYVLPDKFLEVTRSAHAAPLRPANRTSTALYGFDPNNPNDRMSAPAVDPSSRDSVGVSFRGMNGDALIAEGNPRMSATFRSQLMMTIQRRLATTLLPLLAAASPKYPLTSHVQDHAITFTSGDGVSWRIELDPATHLPATLSWLELPPAELRLPPGTATWSTTFTDFRQVAAGLMWPHKASTVVDGRPYEEVTVSKYEVNVTIKDSVFDRLR